MEVRREGSFVFISSVNCPHLLKQRILSGEIASQLDVEKVLAKGKVSDVVLVRDQLSHERFCIKKYYKARLSKLRSFQCIREVRLHCSLSHPNVVTIYGAFEDPTAVSLLLEFAPQGDLYREVMGRGLPEKTAARVVIHVLDALDYLHERNIIHRDIKLENLLKTADGYKLADFGLSVNAAEERPVTKLGTTEYMSPEVLAAMTKMLPQENKDREDLRYGAEVDVWAAGVLSYELLTGTSPFRASQNTGEMIDSFQRGPNFPARMPQDAVSFIRLALCLDPKERPSAAELLNHPWLRKYRPTRGADAPKVALSGPSFPSPSTASFSVTAGGRASPIQSHAAAASVAALRSKSVTAMTMSMQKAGIIPGNPVSWGRSATGLDSGVAKMSLDQAGASPASNGHNSHTVLPSARSMHATTSSHTPEESSHLPYLGGNSTGRATSHARPDSPTANHGAAGPGSSPRNTVISGRASQGLQGIPSLSHRFGAATGTAASFTERKRSSAAAVEHGWQDGVGRSAASGSSGSHASHAQAGASPVRTSTGPAGTHGVVRTGIGKH